MADQVGLAKQRDEEDFCEYPADVREAYLFVCDWIGELVGKYGDKIRIELINAQSFRGIYKSIRFWTQTYPTFIVNRAEKYSGKDKSQLDLIIQRHLATQA